MGASSAAATDVHQTLGWGGSVSVVCLLGHAFADALQNLKSSYFL